MTPRAYEIAETILQLISDYGSTGLATLDNPYPGMDYLVEQIDDKNNTKNVVKHFLMPSKYIKPAQMGGNLGYAITPLGINYLRKVSGNHSITLQVDDAHYAVASEDAELVSKATIDNGIINITIRPEIYAHIKSYLLNEDYFHAVDEAYKFVRNRLKAVAGSEKATEAFGYDANNPVDFKKIFGHEPTDDPEKDFFKGVRFLHLSVQFLRNEKSHTLATTLDKNLALHYIGLANLAYDLVSREVQK